ncbi:aminotransferase, class V family protein [Cardiosporidium cionae]|uniref:Aminotransferase, class V family protein n=1 Tax=Cardiosporidium cionae TaxID=476202 RepID=A0ABQ7J9E1_9APIC|nr:aminotransferase, class V family protein [Cardiosporidium cionae]|eukprot:KAF8820270.1 aminotransferase, class V family protein [Cardiosporidium cionae]
MDFLHLLGYLEGVEEWRRREFCRISKASINYDAKNGKSRLPSSLHCFFSFACNRPLPLQLVKKDIFRINYSSPSVYWPIETSLRYVETSPFFSPSYIPLWQELQTGFAMLAQRCIRLSPCTYLDHAGCTLYPESLVRKFMGFLLQSTIGNPHSEAHAQQWIDLIRAQLLNFLGDNSMEYSLIFTSGATDALRLLAESFPFEEESVFAYTSDCHTSLLGMRAIAMQKGAFAWSVPLQMGSTDSGWSGLNGTEPISLNCVTSRGMTNFFVCSSLSPDIASPVDARPFTESRMPCVSPFVDVPKISRDTHCFQSFESVPSLSGEQSSPSWQEDSLTPAIYCLDSHTENIRKRMYFPMLPSNKNLLALTGESNLSGERPDLSTLKSLLNRQFSSGSSNRGTNEDTPPKRKWYVLLDAAKLAASYPIDLSKWPVDFVVVSMYKIFGYPTGLGALLVRHKSSFLLRHHYFGGGSVLAMSAFSDFVVPKQDLVGSLERGTPNFQAILSIPFAIDEIYGHAFSRKQLCDHTMAVTRYAYFRMISLRHPPDGTRYPCALIPLETKLRRFQKKKTRNTHSFLSRIGTLKEGIHLCTVFGKHASPQWRDLQGPTIAFILHYKDGSVIPHSFIRLRAAYWNIRLRVGCHCNIGGCQEHLHLTDKNLRLHYEMGHVCGDYMDILKGCPTGCVRISFGFSSIKKDVDRFILFLVCEFLGRSSPDTVTFLPSPASLKTDDAAIFSAIPATEKPKAMEESMKKCSEFHSSIQDAIFSISHDRESIPKEGDNPMEKMCSVETMKDNLMAPPTVERQCKGWLRSITLYPLKGCTGISTVSWMLDTRNSCLLWDRQYCLMEYYREGRIRLISKRAIPALSRIRTDVYLPVVDSEQGFSTNLSFADNLVPLLVLSADSTPADGVPPSALAESSHNLLSQNTSPSHVSENSATSVAPLALPLCSPLEWRYLVSVIKDAAQLVNGGYEPTTEQLLSWMPPILHSSPLPTRSTSLECEALKSCSPSQELFSDTSLMAAKGMHSYSQKNPLSLFLDPGASSNLSSTHSPFSDPRNIKESDDDVVPLTIISSPNATKNRIWLLPESKFSVQFSHSQSFGSEVTANSKVSIKETGFSPWYCKGLLGDMLLFAGEPTDWWMRTSSLHVCVRAAFSFEATSDIVSFSCPRPLSFPVSCNPFVNQAPLLLLNANTLNAMQKDFSVSLEIERFVDFILRFMS